MQIRDKDRDGLKIRSLYRQTTFPDDLLRPPKNHDNNNNKHLVKGLLFDKYFFYVQTISLDTQRSLLRRDPLWKNLLLISTYHRIIWSYILLRLLVFLLNLNTSWERFSVSDLIIEPSSAEEMCNNCPGNLVINLSTFFSLNTCKI